MSTATTSERSTMSRQRSNVRNFTEQEQARWSDAVQKLYGVRLSPEQFYIARGLLVMCGSEYVAQLAEWSNEPSNATAWTTQINHFVRGTGRLDTAERTTPNDTQRSTFDEQLDSFGERQASAGYNLGDDTMPCGCASGSCYCDDGYSF